MLKIISFTLGPAFTNAYLVADTETKDAVVIDPAWDGQIILAEAKRQDCTIQALWYTHAHFDHFGGAAQICNFLDSAPDIAMHPADRPLWDAKGGVAMFGLEMQPGPEPNLDLAHGQILMLGASTFEVRFAPGHSPGHVMFYCADLPVEPGPAERTRAERSRSTGLSTTARRADVLFSGDVIFQRGIGRTDLPGGDYETLMRSIHAQVLTLPDDVRILSGHGPETTVGEERRGNPFLR